MRNPSHKLVYALLALGTGALLFQLALSGRLGPEDAFLTGVAGVIGFTLLLVSAYFVPASLLAARGRARLLAGGGVVARWRVGGADWERFSASMPRWSRFSPRRVRPAEGVEIIAGQRSVLIDDCYIRLDPGKRAGMQSAEWAVQTNPACIVIVIGDVSRVASTGSYTIRRWRLLLPVPAAALNEGSRALRHYQLAIAGVYDLGDLARRSPILTRRIFWTLLAASLFVMGGRPVAACVGSVGRSSPRLAMGGFGTAVGILVVGWVHLRQRKK